LVVVLEVYKEQYKGFMRLWIEQYW